MRFQLRPAIYRKRLRHGQDRYRLEPSRVLSVQGKAILLENFKAAFKGNEDYVATTPEGETFKPTKLTDDEIINDRTRPDRQGYVAGPLDGIWARPLSAGSHGRRLCLDGPCPRLDLQGRTRGPAQVSSAPSCMSQKKVRRGGDPRLRDRWRRLDLDSKQLHENWANRPVRLCRLRGAGIVPGRLALHGQRQH